VGRVLDDRVESVGCPVGLVLARAFLGVVPLGVVLVLVLDVDVVVRVLDIGLVAEDVFVVLLLVVLLLVVLEIEPEASWVAEVYPVEAVEVRDDGRLRVTLAISARPWLERLLLRLGPRARVVEVVGDDSLDGCAAVAARRVLARYDS
jgi:hypothetical protein